MPILMKAIKPGTKFNSSMIWETLKITATGISRDILKDYEKTVETWDHKVTFKREVKVDGKGITISITTDDEIYGYVDKGTGPHDIYPKKPGGVLVFQATYMPKSIPGVIGSKAGGASGSTVFTKGVHHPGYKGAKFTANIADKWQRTFSVRMDEALRKGVQKSRYGMGSMGRRY